MKIAKLKPGNFLVINGSRIDLTEEQINSIKQSFNIGNIQLSALKPAETFKIGEYEFFVLVQIGNFALVLLKGLLYDNVFFGEKNNYDGSNADKLCIEFGDRIESLVGAGNLINHAVNLTSDDGLKCYGTVTRKMSLLTAMQYRKYVYCIDEHKLDKCWWLATANSTPKHEDEFWIKCVTPHGNIDDDYYDYNNNGIRPCCVLKSDIFVSK